MHLQIDQFPNAQKIELILEHRIVSDFRRYFVRSPIVDRVTELFPKV